MLAAEPEPLRDAGLDARAILPFRLVAAAAERLARREAQIKPLLGSLAALEAYLRQEARGGTRILFLDNRNRLLGDEPATVEDEADHGPVRTVLRRALALHATALLVADDVRPLDRAGAKAATRLRSAASMLSIVLHDRVTFAASELASYRRCGLL